MLGKLKRGRSRGANYGAIEEVEEVGSRGASYKAMKPFSGHPELYLDEYALS